jgi:hypothetical protein
VLPLLLALGVVFLEVPLEPLTLGVVFLEVPLEPLALGVVLFDVSLQPLALGVVRGFAVLLVRHADPPSGWEP